MSIAWPWIFSLLPLPLIIFFLIPRAENEDNSALWVPFFSDMQSLSAGSLNRSTTNIFTQILASIIWVLLVFSAARPQWHGNPIAIPTEGRDLMLAVDISGSMKAEDMVINRTRVSRIVAVKYIASDFIDHRVGDRVGLIVFGSNAYVHAPLSFDRKTVQQLLIDSNLGIAGNATAIGDAIGLTVKKLRDQKIKNRTLILLTDGRNTAGDILPLQAADLAKKEDLKIYTIGFAAEPSFFSSSGEPDEQLMTKIADMTGGRYFRAYNTHDLAKIYKIIDKMEPIAGDDEIFRPIHELYYWPLALALFLSVISIGKKILLKRAG